MNTSHYPSLELCKKLTEIGFPETENIYEESMQYNRIINISEIKGNEDSYRYVCPSVMEMLDYIPSEHPNKERYFFVMQKIDDGVWSVAYAFEFDEEKDDEDDFGVNTACSYSNVFVNESLPNAIAEMILWLHENNHINFAPSDSRE